MRWLLLVGGITILGALLRVPSFSDSLWADELSAYFVVSGNDPSRILDLVESDQEVTPPLYFLLARLLHGVTDSLRWIPLAAGIAAIPLTYLLGTWTIGRRGATVGAVIVAASPFLVFYSTEARPYALLMLAGLGSTLALVRAADCHGRWWWAPYATLSAAVMYIHYTGAFLLAGQAAWAVVAHRGCWRWIIGANVAAAVAWLPWLSGYLEDQDSPGSVLIGALSPFDLDTLRTDVLHWAVGHPLTVVSLRDMPGDRALLPIVLGLAIVAIAVGIELARRGRLRAPGPGLSLVLVLAWSTPVLAALYSTFGESVFMPRNLIAASPGLALLLGWIVTRPRARVVWIPATALLLAGFAVGGLRMLEDESRRPAYDDVAAFIEARGGGVVVDHPGPSPGPLTALDVAIGPRALRLGRPPAAAEWARDQPDGPGQFTILPTTPPHVVARQAVKRAGRDGRIYLVHPGVFAYEQPPAGPVAEFSRALPRGYRATAVATFPALFGLGTLSVYELTPS